ncbi:MAG: MFS transporter [Pseudomonadota bacterium]
MTEAVAMAPSQSTDQVGYWTKIFYGFGSVAYGVKENGFSYFILLFYGTVMGVDPGLVGLAIFVALILDAFSDPIVGYLSDNWRSAWGRRHPFMYGAAVPVAVSYFLIWNPPEGWSDTGLLVYMFVLAVVIRTFITFYETPSSALLPELTQDYDKRTTLQAYRLFFGWVGGNAMSVLMFGLILVPTAAYPIGILNKDGYALYGTISSALIFAAIMISAIGTHRHIPHLQQPPPKRQMSVGKIFKEIFETLSERSFLALFVATLFGSIAAGASAAFAFTVLRYFWEFTEGQLFIWTSLVFVSALGGLLIAPRLALKLGKKRAVLILGVIAFTVAPAPVILRLFDLMPANGDPILFPIMLAVNTIDLALVIALQSILFSMIADLVEESELKTGRRSEGLFYAAVTFTRKCNQGLGLFAAGVALSLIGFPEGATPGEVESGVIWSMGLSYAAIVLTLYGLMLVCVGFYSIDRDSHNDNLRKLAERNTTTKEGTL